MSDVTVTAGRVPIPFGKLSGYAGASRIGRYAGSSDLVGLCTEALVRLQNATDVAQQKCQDHRGYFQRAFDYMAGQTATASICAAAAQMQLDHDEYAALVEDPNTTDETLAQILVYINRNADISDLLALAKASSAGHIIGDALIRAPGTAIGLAAEGVEEVAKPIFFNIPWWGWVIGGLYVANKLGWVTADTFRKRSR